MKKDMKKFLFERMHTIGGMPLKEEIDGSLFLKTFDTQNDTAERTISNNSLWGNAGVWRYKIENAGDILRELSSRGESPDPNYLEEKVNYIENWLNEIENKEFVKIPDNIKTLDDFNKTNLKWSNAVDGREYLEKFYNETLNKIASEYKKIPIYYKEHKIAQELVLNLIYNNIDALKFNLKQIRQYINTLRKEHKLTYTRIK